MEDQVANIQEVHRPFNLLHAGLSLICPGLGQVIQGRPLFLAYVIAWAFAMVGWIPFVIAMWESAWDVPIQDKPIPVLLIVCWTFIPPIFFILFTVLDAATWERGKQSPFETRLFSLGNL